MSAFSSITRQVYDRILRPWLPYKISVHNGVPVRGVAKLLDATDEWPTYEEPLVNALRGSVKRDDDVVVVGGGLGVSTVVAACRTDGRVITYEASEDRVVILRNTVSLNCVGARCTINHSVVGPAVEIIGKEGDTDRVRPGELPDCDILELDCEGAEIDILKGLEIRPRVLIVETHGTFGAPEEDVRIELDRLGYSVTDRGVEVADEGVFVLTAKRDEDL